MWSSILTPEAVEDLKTLSAKFQARILDKVEWMGENADLLRHEALQGDEWVGCFRYRIGNYRVIYRLESEEQVLRVLKIGHRRDVYR